MSVRRLDPVQPTAPFSFNVENLSWAKKTIAAYPTGKQASAVIALLWRAQEQNEGWLSRPAMEYIGTMLNMAFIRVYEVATFYTMFQLSPVGKKAHIQVCGTTPCMLRGSEELLALCRKKIHPEPHHLNSDGSLSWEEVECLGACVNAPMVQVWKDTYEDLTPEVLSGLIDDWQAGRKTTPGPQNARHHSMALGGATTLLDKTLYNKQRSFKRVEAPPPPPAVVGAAAPVAAPVNAPVISRVAKVEKAPAKKVAAKKPAAKKAAVKKAVAKKTVAKKPAAKKAVAKKPVAKKAVAKKSAIKTSKGRGK